VNLADEFEARRSTLLQIAYRLLGSVSEAEDVVQDAWLRLDRAVAQTAIENLTAYLTTTVTRLAYDQLGSARARRETYVGEWLPEPWVEDLDLADRVVLDESVSMALMRILERLSPAERVVFVLHDSFGMPFEEIGDLVGRSAAATRQLAARARQRVEEERPRRPASAAEHLNLLGAFALAVQEGDLESLVSLLDPEVVWYVDGGGNVRASRKPQHGALHVARTMITLARNNPQTGRAALVNGAPGAVTIGEDGLITVLALTIDDGRIVAIDQILNPDKLTHLEI
jgi:RNA polymerase sigma-70 factor (ECF subfamily)